MSAVAVLKEEGKGGGGGADVSMDVSVGVEVEVEELGGMMSVVVCMWVCV